MPDDGVPRVAIADPGEWRSWLEAHAAASSGIWLVYEKGPARRLSYDQIVDEAVAFGWVDSRPRSLDDSHAMLYLAPRKPASNWSRVNKARVARLRSEGRMTPLGEAAIVRAQANGAWTALDDIEDLVEPADLRAALDASGPAAAAWASFPRSARRAILEWLAGAKREETRRGRITTIVSEAEQGRRANQWRQPKGRPGGAGVS